MICINFFSTQCMPYKGQHSSHKKFVYPYFSGKHFYTKNIQFNDNHEKKTEELSFKQEKYSSAIDILDTDDDYKDKARKLIFGERKYQDFTEEEKQIVDSYQEYLFKEDVKVLPNTKADLEQQECYQMLSQKLALRLNATKPR